MEVLLHIEGSQFVLSIEEALAICEKLNACNQLGKEWSSAHGANLTMFTKPNIRAASVTPITAITRLEVEANEKSIAEQRR